MLPESRHSQPPAAQGAHRSFAWRSRPTKEDARCRGRREGRGTQRYPSPSCEATTPAHERLSVHMPKTMTEDPGQSRVLLSNSSQARQNAQLPTMARRVRERNGAESQEPPCAFTSRRYLMENPRASLPPTSLVRYGSASPSTSRTGKPVNGSVMIFDLPARLWRGVRTILVPSMRASIASPARRSSLRRNEAGSTTWPLLEDLCLSW